MTTGDCKFLKNILALTSNISLERKKVNSTKIKSSMISPPKILPPKNSLLSMLLQYCFVKLQLLQMTAGVINNHSKFSKATKLTKFMI